MKNLVLAFKFITLISLLMGVIALILLGIGYATNEITKSFLLLFAPLCFSLFVLNIFVTLGLEKKQKWAYVVGILELGLFLFDRVWSIISEGITANVFFVFITLSILIVLINSYKGIYNESL